MMTDSLGKMDQVVMKIEEEEDDSFDKFDDAHSQWKFRTKLQGQGRVNVLLIHLLYLR